MYGFAAGTGAFAPNDSEPRSARIKHAPPWFGYTKRVKDWCQSGAGATPSCDAKPQKEI